MARLVLVLMLLAAAALAVAGALGLARALRAASTEASMPRSARTASFVLLVLLLLGVAGGWLPS